MIIEPLQHLFAFGHRREFIAAYPLPAVQHRDDGVKRGCVHALVVHANSGEQEAGGSTCAEIPADHWRHEVLDFYLRPQQAGLTWSQIIPRNTGYAQLAETIYAAAPASK